MICVDASVAVMWVLEEEHSVRAEALYSNHVQQGEEVVAPALLPFEVTNAIRKRMIREGVSIERAQALLEIFEAFQVRTIDRPNLSSVALDIATQYGLRATYDAHYLAAARLLRCDFWTNDRRLVNAVGSSLPFVRWIGDYQS